MQPVSTEQDFNERLRILESRYGLVRERMLLMNQNMVNEYKKSNQSLRGINQDMEELKKDMEELKESMRKIVRELNFFARKHDLKAIDKYIKLWNPLNFVTEKEVIRLIEERGDKHT